MEPLGLCQYCLAQDLGVPALRISQLVLEQKTGELESSRPARTPRDDFNRASLAHLHSPQHLYHVETWLS